MIVTRNGKPVAAIERIDETDLEDFLLERSEKFWEMIARARKGKTISLNAVAKALGRKRRAR